jgi:hypothetical protein
MWSWNKKRHKTYIRKISKQDERALGWVLIIFLVIIALAFIPAVRVIAIIIASMIALYYARKFYKRYLKYQRGETYQIQHECPNCGRLNPFKYPTGSPQGGVTIRCHYCQRPYTR